MSNTAALPLDRSTTELGIIGLGDMGRLYARMFADAGWTVNACDLPERYDELRAEFGGERRISILKDGFAVVRRSDFVIFSVETSSIDAVVARFGPAMKLGSIACGQTSVKAPEIAAFEKYLPDDIQIVTCHSLHGPNVNPHGQPLVVIRHRSDQRSFDFVVGVLEALGSDMVYLDAKEHDRITADTQAVTHVAFLSMGTTWKTQSTFPWENPSYVGGIENVKTIMALRIYGSKWHVYSGLALMNPSVMTQVNQYARSVSDLFKLMIQENEAEFVKRIKTAREFVFGSFERSPILLSDGLLDQFSLSAIPKHQRKPNSHLSLLAIVDCWWNQGIKPYDHLICQTPPFRLLLGITEFLFRNEDMLDEAIQAALYDKSIRPDDCEFYTATKGWVECIGLGSPEAYRQRFEETARFFADRATQGKQVSAKMVELIAQKTHPIASAEDGPKRPIN
ncbi:prephenate dehydrogenase (NADP(+)) [Polyrhizophydium stewartii]|uniref:Prephenate dehydrogenase (NADP(+)) n=1 Tax=Polyrhizophydium stewartii TaxID=2732419 RepID=A0ABR4NHD4_9FUNG